jgi:hypothetical protein
LEVWRILTLRYGQDICDPTPEDLRAAARELFVEADPSMSEASYAEHPDAWLRVGFDDGPMYVLTVDRVGSATFEEWADSDYGRLLSPGRRMAGLSAAETVELWSLLCAGSLETLRAKAWAVDGAG